TGGDAFDAYALVVINTNGRKDSATADGDEVMKLGAGGKGTTLVDVLDPERRSYSVPASGELRLTVPKQRAMILVPEADVKD
ncbi:MAG: alpha-amylase, partial [Myxococcales bacterium]|nr:alpha-amylase [Myxococcales bacterium]